MLGEGGRGCFVKEVGGGAGLWGGMVKGNAGGPYREADPIQVQGRTARLVQGSGTVQQLVPDVKNSTCFFIVLRSLTDRWRRPGAPSAPPSWPSPSMAAVCAAVPACSGAANPYLHHSWDVGSELPHVCSVSSSHYIMLTV